MRPFKYIFLIFFLFVNVHASNEKIDRAKILEKSSKDFSKIPGVFLKQGSDRIIRFSRAATTSSGMHTFVPYGSQLFEVNQATDNIVKVSGLSIGTGLLMRKPYAIALSDSEASVFVIDSDQQVLFKIDLATGNRLVVADSYSTLHKNVIINKNENSAYVIDDSVAELYSVDLNSGTKSIISNYLTGEGADFFSPIEIDINKTETKIHLRDKMLKHSFLVDLATGDRTMVDW